MTPQERALPETQVSLERQRRQLELRYQAETEKLHMAAEEDLVESLQVLAKGSVQDAGYAKKGSGSGAR